MKDKAKQMAKYAYENVPFYQDMKEALEEDFSNYPIITKKNLQERAGQSLSPEYILHLLREELQTVYTSGSSGRCLEILWHPAQLKKSNLMLWYLRYRYYNISPKQPYCFFYTTRYINGEIPKEDRNGMGLGFSKHNLSERRLLEIYERLLEYEPVWMFGQPSMFVLLLQVAQKNELPRIKTLQYIELTGEYLFEKTRKSIEDFYGCSVANQYGCYEVNSIAYECPHGAMHVMDDNVFVEVIDENEKAVYDKEGSVCITSLQNRAMPFIRYRLDDIGVLHPAEPCKCGRCTKTLQIKKGRSNDYVINRDGTRLHADIFSHAVDEMNLMGNAILQFQVVQEDYEVFRVRLVMDEEGDDIEEEFMQALGDFVQGRQIFIEYAENLLVDEQTGKLAWFTTKLQTKGEF